MHIFLIILAVIAGLLLLLFIYAKVKMKNVKDVAPHDKILTLTDANFSPQLKGKTVLVDFWADWCMPCKMIAPVLNGLADELPDTHHIGKLEVDRNQTTAQKFNVRSIPTLIVFKDGKEVNRIVGVKSKDFLKKELLKH